MKKILIMTLLALFVCTSAAQASSFSSDTFAGFTLHTYQSDDPLGDASFIIESKNKLVILEPQAFQKNIKELDDYVAGLGKPLDTILVSFHAGGLDHFKSTATVTTRAMDGFMKSAAAKGMLAHFAKVFNGAMDTRVVPFGKVIGNDQDLIIDGVTYRFIPTELPGMPGSNVVIGDTVFYQHFAPSASMHASPFQINGKAAINGALADAHKGKSGGYKVFVGAHFPGKGYIEDLDFEIVYLQTLKKAVAGATGPEDVVLAMQKAFPGLKGEDNLKKIAGKMFSK